MKNNLSNMMCLDIYLSSLDKKEADKVRTQIKCSITEFKPLLSWHTQTYFCKKEMDIQKIHALAKKYNWKNDFDTLFSKNDFEALVLTDLSEKIIWVNDGFTEMTGYSKNFALKKHPSFLQGETTSKNHKQEIKSNLQKGIPFELAIINYKKDKTPYTCKVQIFPLYSNKVTHYIALENQIG